MAKRTLFILLVILSPISIEAAAQSKAGEIGQCVKDRVLSMQQESRKPIVRPISAHCEPGHNEVFRGCVGRDVRDDRHTLSPSSGYRLVAASGAVVRTGGDTPDRTGVSLLSQSSTEVVGRAWCNGHGCGGEGAVHVDGEIRATEEKILTDEDRNSALDYCLNKVLK